MRQVQPPRRLVVASKEPDQPEEDVMEVTLTADGDQTIMILEHRELPLEFLAGYGAGTQVHVEDLESHIAGRERADAKPRWDLLMPLYQELAAKIG